MDNTKTYLVDLDSPRQELSVRGLGFVIELDWLSAIRTQKINSRTNQKGYDKSETTVGKLLARRIQICLVHFCVIHF